MHYTVLYLEMIHSGISDCLDKDRRSNLESLKFVPTKLPFPLKGSECIQKYDSKQTHKNASINKKITSLYHSNENRRAANITENHNSPHVFLNSISIDVQLSSNKMQQFPLYQAVNLTTKKDCHFTTSKQQINDYDFSNLKMKKHKEVSSNIQVEPIDLSTKLSNQYIPSFGGLLDLVSSNPSLEDSLQLNNNNIGDIQKDISNEIFPVDLSNKYQAYPKEIKMSNVEASTSNIDIITTPRPSLQPGIAKAEPNIHTTGNFKGTTSPSTMITSQMKCAPALMLPVPSELRNSSETAFCYTSNSKTA